jgi:hypothetical protein
MYAARATVHNSDLASQHREKVLPFSGKQSYDRPCVDRNEAVEWRNSVFGDQRKGVVCFLSPRDQTLWEELVAHGLPLAGTETPRGSLSAETLLRCVSQAISELGDQDCIQGEDRHRKVESLGALLLALRESFPTVFKRFMDESGEMAELIPAEIPGRLIKLKRIAERKLSDYL